MLALEFQFFILLIMCFLNWKIYLNQNLYNYNFLCVNELFPEKKKNNYFRNIYSNTLHHVYYKQLICTLNMQFAFKIIVIIITKLNA